MEKDRGELMLVKNFGALQGLTNLRPSDYIHYLEAFSMQSKRIVYPQLHVALSAKGHEMSKEGLTELAVKWMEGMGYGDNPYLLIYHKDTDNNHIHVVSTRIGPDGKKVKDSFEQIRAYQVLNNLLGVNESLVAAQDLQKAMAYSFSSRAQWMMLLEYKGYSVSLKENEYQIAKYGKVQSTMPVSKVDQRVSEYQLNKQRLIQLRAIIDKYRSDFRAEIHPEKYQLPGGGEGKVTGYTSDLAQALQEKFGMQILFHAKDNKPPYGYTVIDHAQKTVYKGGQLMPLAAFIAPGQAPVNYPETARQLMPESSRSSDATWPWPENPAGGSNEFLTDDAAEYIGYDDAYPTVGTPGLFIPAFQLDISDDIDDEQINGRNRRRKRKARTNTR